MCIFPSHMGLPEAVNILDQQSEDQRKEAAVSLLLCQLRSSSCPALRPWPGRGRAVLGAVGGPAAAERPPLQSLRACPGAGRCGMTTNWLPRRWGGDGRPCPSSRGPGFRPLQSPCGHRHLRFPHILSRTLLAPGAPAPGGALRGPFLVLLVQSLPLASVWT